MDSQKHVSESSSKTLFVAGELVDDPIVTRRTNFQFFGTTLALDAMLAFLIIHLCILFYSYQITYSETVAKPFQINHRESFAPVAKLDYSRLVLPVSTSLHWEVLQCK